MGGDLQTKKGKKMPRISERWKDSIFPEEETRLERQKSGSKYMSIEALIGTFSRFKGSQK